MKAVLEILKPIESLSLIHISLAAVITIIAALLLYRFYVIPNILYPTKYSEYVDKYSEEYGLEKTVVYAVIKAESGFDAGDRSHTGARGLMQIMPETGEWAAELIGIEEYDAEKLYDPCLLYTSRCV